MASRVSQAMVEVLGQVDAADSDARVSQSVVEVGGQMPASAAFARVSQCMVEVLMSVRPASPGGGSGRWYYDLWFEDELWREEDVAP